MDCSLIYIIQIVREAYMILSIRSHTKDAILFSMILKVLNLVQEMSWKLCGTSFQSDLLQLSWRISYMQFGIFALYFVWLTELDFHRYCIPMDSARPVLPTELEFFSKGTGNGKSWIQPILSTLMSEYHFYSPFGGCIHQIWWSNNSRRWKIRWYRGW